MISSGDFIIFIRALAYAFLKYGMVLPDQLAPIVFRKLTGGTYDDVFEIEEFAEMGVGFAVKMVKFLFQCKHYSHFQMQFISITFNFSPHF